MSFLVEYNENTHASYSRGKRAKKSVQSLATAAGNTGKKHQDAKRVEAPGKEDRGGGGGGGGAGRNGVEKMNKMAVQRVDGDVESILATVPQVVLYQYDKTSITWERTSIEGTLFIYQRLRVRSHQSYDPTSPSHGVVLLNRLSSDNLQLMIRPGSEFRVQGQFVLFKKHTDGGGVFALCFSDSQIALTNGRLLDEFSRKAHSNASGHAPPLRSHSVPVFPNTQLRPAAGERMDVRELLENAGNAYLNQGFSDDAGSSGRESPSSDPVTFSISQPHSTTSQLFNVQGHPLNGGGIIATTFSSVQQASGSISSEGSSQVKRSTPRTIPKLVNMSTTPPPATTHPSTSSSSSSSHVTGYSTPHTMPQNRDQYSSRVASSSHTPTQRSTGASDAGNRVWSAGSAGAVSRQTPTTSGSVKMSQKGETSARSATRPLSSSSSSGPVSAPSGRRKLHVPPPTTRGTDNSNSSQEMAPPPQSFQTASPGVQFLMPLQEVPVEPPLARQLFESHPSAPPNPAPLGPPHQSNVPVSNLSSVPTNTIGEKRATTTNPATTTSTANPSHLQTLFSRSLTPSALSSSLPTSLLSKQPMSLAEVEKQMKEEAPSPDAIPGKSTGSSSGVFSLRTPGFNHAAVSSISTNPNLPSSLPTTTAGSSTTGNGGEEHHVLRQPSSFAMTTPPSRANTTPVSKAMPPSRASTTPLSLATPLSTHNNTVGSGVSNSSGVKTGQAGVRRSTTAIELHVVPPTPVVSSADDLTRKLLTNGAFPDAPPLIHSPGMRAPPVSQTPPVSHQGQQPYEQTDSASTPHTTRGTRGDTSSRRGKRTQRKPGSPLSQGKSPSPQLNIANHGADVPLGAVGTPPKGGVAGTPPIRSYSVPNNMNPDVSVVVSSQGAPQSHALLSPQQFSLSETPPPVSFSSTPPPPPPLPPPGHPLREQLRQTLVHLIQNDEDFFNQIYHTYCNIGVSRNPQ